MSFRRIGVAVVAAGLGVAAAFAGCGKTKESLVLVTVETAAGDTTLKTVAISVGTHSQTFTLGAGVPAAPGVTYGLYVPSSFTGKQTVTAVAFPAAGNCNGASGGSHVSIGTVGEVDGPVVILLSPADVCSGVGGSPGTGGTIGTGGTTGVAGSAGAGQTGGAGGAAGSTGLGGHGGTGTGGAAGSGGSAGAGGSAGRGGTAGTGTGGGTASGITVCTEYDHDTTGQCQNSSCTGTYAIWGAAFSPTNSNLAVTSGTDGRTKVWTISGTAMAPEGHVVPGGTGSGVLAFSPDGTLLAIGQSAGVQIVSTSTWTALRTLTVAKPVYGVGFSPDGTQVITLDTDDTPTPTTGHLYVHSVTNLTALHSVALNSGWALGVSPVMSSGALLVAVTTTTGNALVYSLTSAGFSAPTTLTVTGGSYAETAVFSPNGSLLAAGGDDGILQFWPIPLTGTPQAPSIDVSAVTVNASADVDVVAFSPSTPELAIGAGFSGSVTTYSTTLRTKIGVEQDTSNGYDVTSLGYSPNGKYIIGGEADCGCVFLCVH